MSWGYTRKASLENKLLRSKTLINTTTLGTKIYKSSAKIGTIQVVLHDNRSTNISKSIAIITTVFGKKALDVTKHFKSFKEVYNYICNWLEYNSYKIGAVKEEEKKMELKKYIEYSEVEKLDNKNFSQLIELLFKNIKELKVAKEIINKVWNNIYNDIFNRGGIYLDNDIVILHEKYLELMEQFNK